MKDGTQDGHGCMTEQDIRIQDRLDEIKQERDDLLTQNRALTKEKEEALTRLRPLGGDCALTDCGKCYACQQFRAMRTEDRLARYEQLEQAVRGLRGAQITEDYPMGLVEHYDAEIDVALAALNEKA